MIALVGRVYLTIDTDVELASKSSPSSEALVKCTIGELCRNVVGAAAAAAVVIAAE